MAQDTRFTATATTPPSNPSPIMREALPAAESATAFATTAGLHRYTNRRCSCAELHRRTSDGRELLQPLRRSDAPTSLSVFFPRNKL